MEDSISNSASDSTGDESLEEAIVFDGDEETVLVARSKVSVFDISIWVRLRPSSETTMFHLQDKSERLESHVKSCKGGEDLGEKYMPLFLSALRDLKGEQLITCSKRGQYIATMMIFNIRFICCLKRLNKPKDAI